MFKDVKTSTLPHKDISAIKTLVPLKN